MGYNILYMPENFSTNASIEAEIAELSAKIEEKRRQLESGKGVIEERELVKSAIGEKLSNTVSSNTAPVTSAATTTSQTTPITPPPTGKSYLDYLDDESRAIVEGLVESVFTNGLDKTLKNLESQEPFIIDAFHDVLTDKIYDELKKRGAIK